MLSKALCNLFVFVGSFAKLADPKAQDRPGENFKSSLSNSGTSIVFRSLNFFCQILVTFDKVIWHQV